MNIQIDVPMVIERSPDEVFKQLVNWGQWPQWAGGGLVSIQPLSSDPLRVGSRLRQVNQRGTKRTETFVEVTEWLPNHSLGIQSANLYGVFLLESADSGTRLNTHFTVEATGFTAIMYRLLLKRFVRDDLLKLKSLVENDFIKAVAASG